MGVSIGQLKSGQWNWLDGLLGIEKLIDNRGVHELQNWKAILTNT